MITFTTAVNNTGRSVFDCSGLDSDDKDGFAMTRHIENGSTYYEIDGDHRIFMWDGENRTWVEQ